MKKVVGFNLSSTAQAQIDTLAQLYNLEKSAVIEGLLRGAIKAVSKRIGQPVIKSTSVRGPSFTVADLMWPTDGVDTKEAALAVVRATLLKGDPQPTRRRVKPAQAEARMASLFRDDKDPGKLVNAFFGQPQPERKSPHVSSGWVKGAKDE